MKVHKEEIRGDRSLAELIEILQDAYQAGFSLTSSSPLVPLLEAATDIALRLRQGFQQENQFSEKHNPDIRIGQQTSPRGWFGAQYDAGKSDALGNPKSIKIFESRKIANDPDAPEIFWRLASFFILVKRERPVKQSFMDCFGSLLSQETEVQKDKQAKAKKETNKAFFYRRRNKKNHLKQRQ